MNSSFGQFQSLFGQSCDYLTLLNLKVPETEEVVARVLAIAARGDSCDDIRALLIDSNWRPQLVGGVAMVVSSDPERVVPLCWCAVDSGCWVIPQLLVCLAFADRDFPRQIGERLQGEWRVGVPESARPLATQLGAGPPEPGARAGRALASALAVCSFYEELRPIADAAGDSPYVREAVQLDTDASGKIVERWRARFVDVVARLGHTMETRWQRTC